MTRNRSRHWPDDPELLSQQATARDLGPLFAPELRTMARPDGPVTSQQAALSIVESLSELQQRIYQAFVRYGGMTGKELEQLEEFADLAPSTARKRVTDLHRSGWLRATEAERDGCTVYVVSEARSR